MRQARIERQARRDETGRDARMVVRLEELEHRRGEYEAGQGDINSKLDGMYGRQRRARGGPP